MWQLRKDRIDRDTLLMEESLFTVGNGYLGVRGCFEEGYGSEAVPTIRGSYINGIYDQIPVVYTESAYGFPKIQDKQPRVMDTQTCEVYLDGERASLFTGQHHKYQRILDYQTGVLTRTYRYVTQSGKEASLSFKRLASLAYCHLLAYEVQVIYDGAIELRSVVDTDVKNDYVQDDPRVSSHEGQLLHTTEMAIEQDLLICGMTTTTTQLQVYTAVAHISESPNHLSVEDKKGVCVLTDHGSIKLEKYCVLTDSLRCSNPRVYGLSLLQELKKQDFESLMAHQGDALRLYWTASDIVIMGDAPIQASIRFMLFQMLQSVGIDAYANVSAKGLSGEGYEGQYFWDTEIYIIPALQLNQSNRAKNLLDYRYRILPFARERALELGHRRGAAYPWRTISGIECSSYFPAGTAQYHINADIAYAFIQYYLYTADVSYLFEKGAEVIWETARIWLEIGNYSDGQFMIHNVTGPDEYTAVVSNNYYTNAMAKYHLTWAAEIYRILERSQDKMLQNMGRELMMRLQLDKVEIEAMAEAASKMYLPYDPVLKIHPQDDTFLKKPIWPFEETLDHQYPLLLHFHPLTIYRHQVLKQADTVLAHYLLEDYTTQEVIRNSFAYYEKLTTHDSSLSACIYGIMASRCGDAEKAYAYFLESVDLDLADTHKNTKDGLHMANIAGTILSIFHGFAGMRVGDRGISFRPKLPQAWTGYHYNMMYQGRHLRVEMSDVFKLTLISGEPLRVCIDDLWVIIHQTVTVRPVQAVIFDLDGVLTDTSHQHFLAWQVLAQGLGHMLDLEVKDAIKGISRRESLEIVLKACGILDDFSASEKEALTEKKNAIYLAMIEAFDQSYLNNGALALLQGLKAKGIKIGLASASQNAPLLLERLGITSYFDVIVDPKSIKHGKPAPDIFLKAAEALSIDPSGCLGVEDAYAGIESIKSAGMRAIGIGSKTLLTNAENVYPSLEDLMFLIE